MYPNNEPDKAQIEKDILDHAKHISRDRESGCYDVDVLQKFIYAWHELASYYKLHDADMIAVDIVGVYLDFTHEFSVVRAQNGIPPMCQEQIDETLSDLRSFMDDIISYVRDRSSAQC